MGIVGGVPTYYVEDDTSIYEPRYVDCTVIRKE
jgi:hypothetical protein